MVWPLIKKEIKMNVFHALKYCQENPARRRLVKAGKELGPWIKYGLDFIRNLSDEDLKSEWVVNEFNITLATGHYYSNFDGNIIGLVLYNKGFAELNQPNKFGYDPGDDCVVLLKENDDCNVIQYYSIVGAHSCRKYDLLKEIPDQGWEI